MEGVLMIKSSYEITDFELSKYHFPKEVVNIINSYSNEIFPRIQQLTSPIFTSSLSKAFFSCLEKGRIKTPLQKLLISLKNEKIESAAAAIRSGAQLSQIGCYDLIDLVRDDRKRSLSFLFSQVDFNSDLEDSSNIKFQTALTFSKYDYPLIYHKMLEIYLLRYPPHFDAFGLSDHFEMAIRSLNDKTVSLFFKYDWSILTWAKAKGEYFWTMINVDREYCRMKQWLNWGLPVEFLTSNCFIPHLHLAVWQQDMVFVDTVTNNSTCRTLGEIQANLYGSPLNIAICVENPEIIRILLERRCYGKPYMEIRSSFDYALVSKNPAVIQAFSGYIDKSLIQTGVANSENDEKKEVEEDKK